MMRDFNGPDVLADWLEAGSIDTSKWGTGTYKSIANLWDEYLQGEVSFIDPPLRVVQVVQVLVQQDGDTLREVEQVFWNGERRFRNQPPAEKIKRSESSIDAALRCLYEELGVSREQVSTLVAANEVQEVVKESPSYPGLPTRYLIQRIKARVIGLPKEDFWRENTAVGHGDPVSRHLWAWREDL
jgi:hypothetical protein